MNALVSVVITTYMRSPETLLRAVQSILSQTYCPIEIIVVDDSPDTYELRPVVKKTMEELSEAVTYIQHEDNQGACVARNTGLAAAKGTYIAFLDDDDEWLAEKVEKQMCAFSDDETALVYCGRLIHEDDTGREYIPKQKYRSGYIYEELILENFVGSTSFPLMRKECLESIGGFDPLMRSAQDYDVWLRLSQRYKITFVDEPLVVYHQYSGERISNNAQARIQGQERIIEKNVAWLKQDCYAWWFRHIKLAPEYAKDCQIKKALELWERAVLKCPGQMYINLKYLYYIFREYIYVRRHND